MRKTVSEMALKDVDTNGSGLTRGEKGDGCVLCANRAKEIDEQE